MNFMISIVGWFLWNWAEFSITKEAGDESEKKISLPHYAQGHWETWIGSLVMTTVLLWVGHRQLNLDPFEVVLGTKLGWNDLYLLGSGAAWDAFIFGFKWVKNFFKKKSADV